MTFLNHQDTKTLRAFEPVAADLDKIGAQVVDVAFQVHKTIGPGLMENIYEEAFCCELKDRNIAFERQKIIPVQYKHHKLELVHRLDLLIEDSVIVELKCVDRLQPVHDSQILSYLKLTNLRLGYLINFNVPVIKEGIKRKVL